MQVRPAWCNFGRIGILNLLRTCADARADARISTNETSARDRESCKAGEQKGHLSKRTQRKRYTSHYRSTMGPRSAGRFRPAILCAISNLILVAKLFRLVEAPCCVRARHRHKIACTRNSALRRVRGGAHCTGVAWHAQLSSPRWSLLRRGPGHLENAASPTAAFGATPVGRVRR